MLEDRSEHIHITHTHTKCTIVTVRKGKHKNIARQRMKRTTEKIVSDKGEKMESQNRTTIKHEQKVQQLSYLHESRVSKGTKKY